MSQIKNSLSFSEHNWHTKTNCDEISAYFKNVKVKRGLLIMDIGSNTFQLHRSKKIIDKQTIFWNKGRKKERQMNPLRNS